METQWFFLAGLLIMGLALFGGAEATTIAETQTSPNTFVTVTHQDPLQAHCSLASATSGYDTVWNFYFWTDTHPTLYRVEPLGLQPVPSLAEDFASPFSREDGLWVSTVKLLQGVMWSDGSEVTAEDVAFTMHMFAARVAGRWGGGNTLSMELGGSWASPAFELIDRVEAVDRYTVKFYLTDLPGLAQWEFGLLQWDIFQKAFWEPKLQEALASAEPAKTLVAFDCIGEPSAGPFVTARWEPGTSTELVANPRYAFKGRVSRWYQGPEGNIVGYEEVLPENLGGRTRRSGITSGEGISVVLEIEEGPFVDQVVNHLYGAQASAARAVITGSVDYYFNPMGYDLQVLRGLEGAAGVKVADNASNGLFYLSFNMRKSPFNYLEFRRALRCVIDKELVANTLLQGRVIPAYSVVPPGNAFWHRRLTEEEQQEACIGLSEEERLAKARRMLEEAGFRFDNQGRLIADPEGDPIAQMELRYPNSAYDSFQGVFGEHIVDRLLKLGVPVQGTPACPICTYALVFESQALDIWLLDRWNPGVYPGYLEAFFHSRNTEEGGNSPQGGVCSERDDALTGCQRAYDELADRFLAERDLQRAQELAYELQRLIFENAAYIPLGYVQQQDAYRADRVNWQGLEEMPLLGGLQFGVGFREYVRKP